MMSHHLITHNFFKKIVKSQNDLFSELPLELLSQIFKHLPEIFGLLALLNSHCKNAIQLLSPQMQTSTFVAFDSMKLYKSVIRTTPLCLQTKIDALKHGLPHPKNKKLINKFLLFCSSELLINIAKFGRIDILNVAKDKKLFRSITFNSTQNTKTLVLFNLLFCCANPSPELYLWVEKNIKFVDSKYSQAFDFVTSVLFLSSLQNLKPQFPNLLKHMNLSSCFQTLKRYNQHLPDVFFNLNSAIYFPPEQFKILFANKDPLIKNKYYLTNMNNMTESDLPLPDVWFEEINDFNHDKILKILFPIGFLQRDISLIQHLLKHFPNWFNQQRWFSSYSRISKNKVSLEFLEFWLNQLYDIKMIRNEFYDEFVIDAVNDCGEVAINQFQQRDTWAFFRICRSRFDHLNKLVVNKIVNDWETKTKMEFQIKFLISRTFDIISKSHPELDNQLLRGTICKILFFASFKSHEKFCQSFHDFFFHFDLIRDDYDLIVMEFLLTNPLSPCKLDPYYPLWSDMWLAKNVLWMKLYIKICKFLSNKSHRLYDLWTSGCFPRFTIDHYTVLHENDISPNVGNLNHILSSDCFTDMECFRFFLKHYPQVLKNCQPLIILNFLKRIGGEESFNYLYSHILCQFGC